ncbi:MAG: helix-turn-helix domain-containing protein [Betaproteobacteria bacterium]
MSRSKWMLEHTEMSVTDVGIECGFGDCPHFSRAFKNHFKLRPSSLRRSVRQGRRPFLSPSGARTRTSRGLHTWRPLRNNASILFWGTFYWVVRKWEEEKVCARLDILIALAAGRFRSRMDLRISGI